MANIIRCKLPDGVHRFKPFTVADYRDFLLVRNDMISKSYDEQQEIVSELAADYFGDYDPSIQKYLFLHVFTGSIGKTKIPVTFECPTCGKVHRKLFNISTESGISNPTIELNDDTKIVFKFPSREYDDSTKLILENITGIEFNNEKYEWESLDSETQMNVIDMIEIEKFEEIVKRLKPIYFELKLKCCGDHNIVYDDLSSIFNLLINPDEVFPFYEINHILAKNNYDITSIMNMLPSERSIALALIERDNKK